MRTAQISPVRNTPMAEELEEKSFPKLIEPITAITKNKSWRKNGCETFG